MPAVSGEKQLRGKKQLRTRYLLLLLLLLALRPCTAHSTESINHDLQQILATYQQEQDWFAATDWLKVEIKQQQLALPVFAWVTNLLPPRLRGNNPYQVCSTCFLQGVPAGMSDYLRPPHGGAIHHYLQEARQLTKDSWWRNAAHRARGFLHRLYHERGVVSTVLVALTWLPYTAITEGVIEPMLIGPLHTICPLFQVAYFGTLNFTHTVYRNLHHSMTFGSDSLSLSRRLRTVLSGWQRFPRNGMWHIAGARVHSKDIQQDMATELDDEVLVRLLASPLRPLIAATLLSPTPAVPPSSSVPWHTIHAELTHRDLLRRIYFVETTIAAAQVLIDLHARYLDIRLQDGTLPAKPYRQLQGQLGALQRDVFTLALHLKKLIIVTQLLDDNHRDLVLVDIQRPAALTLRALRALLRDLQQVLHLETSSTTHLSQHIAEFSGYDFILNITTEK